jgi:hypothetical protein
MKEIKLIKVGEHYDLYHRIAEEDLIIGFASTDNTFVNKLSLKNCQEIERGYDLYELAKASMNKINILFNNSLDSKSHTIGFKAGWHHALKILGDKKFSGEDIEEAFADGQLNQLHNQKYFSGSKAYVQLLQQKEWDCIVEMEKVKDETKIIGSVKGVKGSGDKITTYKSIPKLDADGCLILKRKI